MTTLVTASGTTMTEIFGGGPVVAATILGDAGDVTRFATADRFAAYTGTAPIAASSGPDKIYRLSRRGNRQLNHAIHIVMSGKQAGATHELAILRTVTSYRH